MLKRLLATTFVGLFAAASMAIAAQPYPKDTLDTTPGQGVTGDDPTFKGKPGQAKTPKTRPDTAAAGLTGDDPTFKGKAVKPKNVPASPSEGAVGKPMGKS